MLSKLARTFRTSLKITSFKATKAKAPLWIGLTTVGTAISITTYKAWPLFSTHHLLPKAKMMVSDETAEYETGKNNEGKEDEDGTQDKNKDEEKEDEGSDKNKKGEKNIGQDNETNKDDNEDGGEDMNKAPPSIPNIHFAQLQQNNELIINFNGKNWKIIKNDKETAWENLKKIIKDKKLTLKQDDVVEIVLWPQDAFQNYLEKTNAQKLKIAKKDEVFTVQPKDGPPRRFLLLKDVEVWVVRVLPKANGTKWSVTQDLHPFVEIDEYYNVKTLMSFWPTSAKDINNEERFKEVQPLLRNMRKVIDSFILLDRGKQRYDEGIPEPNKSDEEPKPGPSSKTPSTKNAGKKGWRRHSVNFSKFSIDTLNSFFATFWKLTKSEERTAGCAPPPKYDFSAKHLDENGNMDEILTRTFDQWIAYFSTGRHPDANTKVQTKIPGVSFSKIISSYRDEGIALKKNKYDIRKEWPSPANKTKEGVLRWTSDPFKCFVKNSHSGDRFVYVPTCYLFLGMSIKTFGYSNQYIIKNGTLDHLEEVWAYPINPQDVEAWRKEEHFLRTKGSELKAGDPKHDMPVLGFAKLTKHFFEFENLRNAN